MLHPSDSDVSGRRSVVGYMLIGIVAAWLGATWLSFVTTYGLRLTPDSGVFMTHAMRLFHSQEYSIPANRAPLYIFELAAALFIEPFPQNAAAMLSGLHLFCVLLLTGLLIGKLVDAPGIGALGALLLGLLPGHLYVFAPVWTEPTFGILLVGHVLAVMAYWRRKTLPWLALAGLLAAGTGLTRYIGYSIFGVFCVIALLPLRNAALPLWQRAAVCFATGLPMGAHAIRNKLLSGHFHGVRTPTDLTLLTNIGRLTTTIREDLAWFLIPFAIGVLLILIGGFVKNVRGTLAWKISAYMLVLLAAYLALLLYGTTSVVIDPINSRYLSPVYPLFIAIGFLPFVLRSPVAEKGQPLQRVAVWVGMAAALLATNAAVAAERDAFLRQFTQRVNGRCGHQTAGFSLSATRSELAEMFSGLTRRHNPLDVTVLADHKRRQRGRTLFQSSAMFPAGTRPRVTMRGSDFSLSWTERKKPRTLRYWSLDNFRRPAQLDANLAGICAENNLQTILLLYEGAVGNRRFFGDEGLSADLLPSFRITELAQHAHYTAYWCRWKGERAAGADEPVSAAENDTADDIDDE